MTTEQFQAFVAINSYLRLSSVSQYNVQRRRYIIYKVEARKKGSEWRRSYTQTHTYFFVSNCVFIGADVWVLLRWHHTFLLDRIYRHALFLLLFSIPFFFFFFCRYIQNIVYSEHNPSCTFNISIRITDQHVCGSCFWSWKKKKKLLEYVHTPIVTHQLYTRKGKT